MAEPQSVTKGWRMHHRRNCNWGIGAAALLCVKLTVFIRQHMQAMPWVTLHSLQVTTSAAAHQQQQLLLAAEQQTSVQMQPLQTGWHPCPSLRRQQQHSGSTGRGVSSRC